MTNYSAIGAHIGRVTAEKAAAYGDSHGKSGQVLALLYPNGVQPEQYGDLLAIARVVDKLFRLATDPAYGNESPWADIAGYALLGVARSQRNATSSCPGQG